MEKCWSSEAGGDEVGEVHADEACGGNYDGGLGRVWCIEFCEAGVAGGC